MFNPFRKKATDYFSAQEKEQIVAAIKNAEHKTSGEIRVFVENKCSYVDALDRAKEIFFQNGMQQTQQRNAVLVYVALVHRQLAIFGDEGIHQKVGSDFWEKEMKNMTSFFKQDNYAQGIVHVVEHVGNALKNNFPYDEKTDVNELPDDIMFGNK